MTIEFLDGRTVDGPECFLDSLITQIDQITASARGEKMNAEITTLAILGGALLVAALSAAITAPIAWWIGYHTGHDAADEEFADENNVQR